jgi:hypothetical protein
MTDAFLPANSAAFLLAPGPSLTAEDAARVHGRGLVITVNDAWRLAPWADALYASDHPWWRHYRGVPDFAGEKHSIGASRLGAAGVAGCAGIRVWKNCGTLGLEQQPGGLRTGGNSGYAALNMAVQLGARRIVLLGYNMGPRNGRTHFFGDHPSGLNNRSPYASFVRAYDSIVAPLAAAGVTVVNATPDTRLTCFPRLSLDAALESLTDADAGLLVQR